MKMTDGNLRPILGFQQITVDATAGGKSLTVPTIDGVVSGRKARCAIIQAELQDVRWTDDTTAPTASVGMLLKAGSDFLYNGDLAALRFIRATGVSGQINVAYYE